MGDEEMEAKSLSEELIRETSAPAMIHILSEHIETLEKTIKTLEERVYDLEIEQGTARLESGRF